MSKQGPAIAVFGVLLVLACSGKTGGPPSESNPGGAMAGSSSSGGSDATGSDNTAPAFGGSGSNGGSGSVGSGSNGGSGSTGGARSSGPSGFVCGTDSGSPPADEAGLPPEAGGGSEQLGGDCCATALHVSVGGTVQGSTCGGAPSPSGGSPCIGGSPYAFIYVDAPAGTQLVVSASTGVSIQAFVGCTPEPGKGDACTDGLDTSAKALTPSVAARLFLVEHADVDCGDFTFHAASAGSATEAEAGPAPMNDDASEVCPTGVGGVHPGVPCLYSPDLVCPLAGTFGCQCTASTDPFGAATWLCKPAKQ